MRYLKLLLLIVLINIAPVKAAPLYNNPYQNLKVYIEGNGVDLDFLRRNFNRIDFVRDPEVSDVHVIINRQPTGSGGSNYTLSYYSKTIQNVGDMTLSCFTSPDDTDDQKRNIILKSLKMGMMPYMNETVGPRAYRIRENKAKQKNDTIVVEEDPWNSWVFRTDVSGRFKYEEAKDNSFFNSSLRIDKVTDEWKYRFRASYNNRSQKHRKSDTTIISTNIFKSGSASVVKSLTSHWSTGTFFNVYSSTYKNYKLGISVKPGIEYNLFPWDISHKKLFTLGYYLGPVYQDYFEPTEFVLNDEFLFEHSLRANLELVQPWGELRTWVGGEHYINLGDKYEVNIGADMAVRIAKGFSVSFDIAFASVHNQIYLPAEEITDVERLLSTKKMPTQVEFSTGIGIRYQFGSMLNNVVNQRM